MILYTRLDLLIAPMSWIGFTVSKKDPSINATYLPQLKDLCPKDVDRRKEIFMDPITPGKFDNVYYQNLQQGRGLFKSDQALFTDPRSKPTVNLWASNGQLYNQAFVNSMIKLGRVGVKTGRDGNIRSNCETLN